MKWLANTWFGGFIVGLLFAVLAYLAIANKSDWNVGCVPIEHAR